MTALRFATESDGALVMKLGFHDERYGVMKFECSAFSCYAEERETLFFGGDTVLRIKGITQWVGDRLKSYDKYMEPVDAFKRMINGKSFKEQPIASTPKDQQCMTAIIKDVVRSLIPQYDDSGNVVDLDETPKYIKNLALFHLEETPQICLIYHELLSGYEWLSCILKRKKKDLKDSKKAYQLKGTLNLENVAMLFCNSESITFRMKEQDVFRDENCLSLIRGMEAMSKMCLETNIRFQWPSTVCGLNEKRCHGPYFIRPK